MEFKKLPILVHRHVPWSIVGPVVDPDPTPWKDIVVDQHVQGR